MRKIVPKENDENGMEISDSSSKKKKIKEFPRLRLEHEFFSEAKKHEVEKEYTFKVKVKMTGLSISKFQNDSEYDIIEFEQL